MTTHVLSVGTQASPFPTAPHARGVYGAIVAAAALVIGLCAFATGHVSPGSTAVIVATVLGAATTLWLLHTHR